MNQTTKTSVAVVMLILTAVSSFASENQNIADLPPLGRAPALTASTLAKKIGLNNGELAKYRQLGEQSRALAGREAAGASKTTKIVLITIAGVVVVVVVVKAIEAAGAAAILNSSG